MSIIHNRDAQSETDAGSGTPSEVDATKAENATSDATGIDIPHQCELPGQSVTAALPGASAPGGRRPRLIGLDVARAIALIGMVAVHTISSSDANGDLTTAWLLGSGKASALFAVLGGVGLAIMTGRTEPARGRRWARGIARQVLRAVVIFLIGVLLAEVVPWEDVAIILPQLALMFAIGSLFAPLGARALIVLGLLWAVVAPFLSHALRMGITEPPGHNVTLGSLFAAPGSELVYLLLTSSFPVIVWMAYILVGMGAGRLHLSYRRTAAALLGIGAVVTILSWAATWALVNVVGVRSYIASDVEGLMDLDSFTELQVFGGSGTVPTNSWWWLGINAPHTGTPLDLLWTTGIALMVIAACLGLAHVTSSRMTLLAVPGTMTLTLYSLHLLLVMVLGDLPEIGHFLLQIVLLFGFALLWHRFFARGPLEGALAWLTTKVLPSRRAAEPTVSEVGSRA